MIVDNFLRRSRAIAIFLKLAETGGISNQQKSSCYRAAILLTSSIVEGLVFELVRLHSAPGHVVFTKKDHVTKLKVSKSVLGTPEDLNVCEVRETDVLISDNGVDFGKLNLYLKNNNVVTPAQFRMLNRTRLIRNRIHVQLMTTPDTGYTKAIVETVSKPLPFLLSKYRSAIVHL